ncbi:MAG: class I SAM-dependent methyltransferase [Flavobacteriales bacterium]|nr:class I SAM-dependent methyltransferase [Flavobacteriales bacterium]
MVDPFSVEPASAYDREFAFSRIAMAQRRMVWRYLDPLLHTPGQQVLDLNSGTGIDAAYMARRGHHVVATDISEEMLKMARGTARQHGVEHLVSHELIAFSQLRQRGWRNEFQLVLSDMGGLNYVAPEDLHALAGPIAEALVRHGRFVAVVMPDRCIGETLHFLRRGRWHDAFRRGRHDPIWNSLSGSGAQLWYHHPRRFMAAFTERFRLVNIRPIGFFVPPAFVESNDPPGQRMLNHLMHWDEKIGSWAWTARYADHFLIDLERRD